MPWICKRDSSHRTAQVCRCNGRIVFGFDEGYVGFLCGRCAKHYDMTNIRCQYCGSSMFYSSDENCGRTGPYARILNP